MTAAKEAARQCDGEVHSTETARTCTRVAAQTATMSASALSSRLRGACCQPWMSNACRAVSGLLQEM